MNVWRPRGWLTGGVFPAVILLASCGGYGTDEGHLSISGAPRLTTVAGETDSEPDTGNGTEDHGVPDGVLAVSWGATFQISGLGCVKSQVGTAFVAAPGRLITNAHVVAGVQNPRVLGNGRELIGRVVAFDPVTDLAVIAVEEPLPDPLPLGEATAGVAIAILGYDRSGASSVRSGYIEREILATGRDIYGKLAEGRRALEISASVETGFSGGPVVDASGDVVGVMFSRTRGGAPVAYAVQTIEVLAVLDSANSRSAGSGPCR